MLTATLNWRPPKAGYVVRPIKRIPPLRALAFQELYCGAVEGCIVWVKPGYVRGRWTVRARSPSIRGVVRHYNTLEAALATGLQDAQDAIVTARIRVLLQARG
jgi:hypothetical protein